MKTKILVVEDEGLVADDLAERLRRMDYHCCGTVDNGIDALQAVHDWQPDIVLMDIRIRGDIDGIEVASRLRQGSQTAVIFLTAHDDGPTLERARITEPFGYVLKPFSDRELRATIEMAAFRHKAENKQRKMERWLATTLDSIGDGVITTDLEARVTFMNPVAEMITGWRQREALGKNFHEIFVLLDENTLEPCRDLLAHALQDGLTIHLDERYCLRHRQGNLVSIDDSMAPIQEGDVTSGAVVVFRDRTLRKTAQEEKQKLEARIQESQKLESLGLLAAGVAHDFNNLLGIISGNLSLCQEEPNLPQPIVDSMTEIESATQRAGQLCGQMLAHAGQAKMMNVDVDLGALVKSTVTLLRMAIPRSISMDYSSTGEVSTLSGDPRQLQQIILNLVINAAEAIGEKPGTVKIFTSSRWVEDDELQNCRLAPGQRAGHYAILEVSDDGSGMDEIVLSRLFDAFFTTKFQGRGLGLAATAGVLRAHGASVTIQSMVGLGTTFRIFFPTLPVRPVTESAKQLREPGAAKFQVSGLALVVDDESAMCHVIFKMMESFGFRASLRRQGSGGRGGRPRKRD